jgi:hypothetical protein
VDFKPVGVTDTVIAQSMSPRPPSTSRTVCSACVS